MQGHHRGIAILLQVPAAAGSSKLGEERDGNRASKGSQTGGRVLLMQKYYILSMGSISHAIKFAKAIACGQSWVRYRRFCREELKTDPNVLWVRILTEVIHN